MKAILRVFSVSLCAALGSLVIFWPPDASAQSRGADICTILANRIIPDIPRSITSGARSFNVQQVTRDRVYLKCLQLRGQQATSGEASTNSGTGGTFTLFEGAPSGINADGAITGGYFSHSFLRARDGTFTTFDPPGSLSTQTTGINPAGAITGWY
jgi:hypothetical protein